MMNVVFCSVLLLFSLVFVIVVVFFVFSIMISYVYYGICVVWYLFGLSELVINFFKLVFLSFVVIGVSMSLGVVVNFFDVLLFIVFIFNIIGLYLLLLVVYCELESYWVDFRLGCLD